MISFRRFISLTISFSFLVMSYTGIILFLAPKGRVANWNNWELLGLDKTHYTHLHVTFMVLFLFGMIFHIYFNWSSLINYLKSKARTFSLLTKAISLSTAAPIPCLNLCMASVIRVFLCMSMASAKTGFFIQS